MASPLPGPPTRDGGINFTWFNWFKKLFTKVVEINNNVNAIGNEVTILQTAVGGLSYGTYTPTYTNVANTSAGTPGVAQWTQVGNIVTVTGRTLLTITSATTATTVLLTLPVTSDFSATADLNGVVVSADVAQAIHGGTITADTTNDQASVSFRSGSGTGSQNYSFTFQYEVL